MYENMNEDAVKIPMNQEQVVGMAYVPWQHFSKSYEPQRALMIGTIFPELNKPFTGRKGGPVR